MDGSSSVRVALVPFVSTIATLLVSALGIGTICAVLGSAALLASGLPMRRAKSTRLLAVWCLVVWLSLSTAESMELTCATPDTLLRLLSGFLQLYGTEAWVGDGRLAIMNHDGTMQVQIGPCELSVRYVLPWLGGLAVLVAAGLCRRGALAIASGLCATGAVCMLLARIALLAELDEVLAGSGAPTVVYSIMHGGACGPILIGIAAIASGVIWEERA